MKQSKRILAYSALALIVMLAAFGAIAFDTSNVAHAQTVGVPTLTAQASGANTINLSWTAVDDAARYELWVWDSVNEWRQIGGNSLTGTTWSHTGLTEGTTYYYQIRAITADGSNYGWSTRVNEVAGMAPDAPSLTATAGYLQITVSWPAVTGAARYELWAWDGSWTALHTDAAPITGTSYTHTGLTAGRTIYYQGRSVDASGTMSAWSAQTSAEVLSSPNIGAPSLTAAIGDEQVTLTWIAVTAPAGQTIASYEYRYRESGGTFPTTWTNVGNVLTVNVTGLTNGTTYNFELRAVSDTGATGSTASASKKAADVPGAPTLTAVALHYGRLELSWTAPTENGGDAIDSYRIEIVNSQGEWVNEATLPSSRTTYTDSGLTRATEYHYRIYARNAAGEGPAGSDSAVTLANRPEVPAAPVGVLAEGGSGKVTLKWSAPAFNGGSPILAYEYRYKESVEGSYGGWTDAGLKTEVEIDGLTPTKMYTFEVRARNSVGRGPETEEATSTVVTATGPTAAPRLVVSRAADTTDGGDDQFRLEWAALGTTQDGDGDDDGTNAINNYSVQWKSSRSAGDDDTTDWPEDGTAPGVATQVLDEGDPDAGGEYEVLHSVIASDTPLLPGATYYYRVRAEVTGLNENGYGPWSNEVSLTTPANVPSAPSPEDATLDPEPTEGPVGVGVDADSIKISWRAPADNGGAEITGYELQVKTDNTPDDTNDDAFADSDAIITNLPAGRLEHTHDGVRTGLGYIYRVRAINSAGNGEWSESSNRVTTESALPGTPAKPGAPTTSGTGPTVTVSWTPPAQGEFPITRYELQYQRTDDTDDDDADLAEWSDATTVVPTPPTNATYSHANVLGGTMYAYRVRAVSGKGAGDWSDASDVVDVTARAPDAPVLTATTTSSSDILLDWTVPANNGSTITGYMLEWSLEEGSGFAEVDFDTDTEGSQDAPATQTQYNHSGRESGTEYFYRVIAVTAGTNSAASDVDSAETFDGVPGVPAMFGADTATGDDVTGKITINWFAPGTTSATAPRTEEDDGGSAITGYELRIWNVSTQAWDPEASLEHYVRTYTDEDLEPTKTYHYVLRAVNAVGSGPWTSFVSATAGVGLPDAPELTATSAGTSSISLSWTVPNDNGTAITGYEMQRWNSEGQPPAWGENNLLADRAPNSPTVHTDDELDAGTTYYYRIRATTGGAVEGAWSAENTLDADSATTDGDAAGVPGVPQTLAAAQGSDDNIATVEVTWTAPADADDANITGYNVQRWNSDTGLWDDVGTTTAVAASDSPFRDSVIRGRTYFYRVAAVNAQGTGDYTEPASAEVSAAATANPPQMVTATALGPDSIRLSWNEPAPNGATVAGYDLEIWELDESPPAWGTVIEITGAGTTMYVHTNLKPNTRYDYRLRTDGTEIGTAVLAYATTHIGAPDRPVLTAAADGENAIKLTWTVPANNGSPIDVYEISMWDKTAKQWGWNGVAGAVQTVSHPITTYTHSGLDAGTQNIYRVRAVNDAAEDNGKGDWSTITAGSSDAASE